MSTRLCIFENNVSKPKKNVLEKDTRGIRVDKDYSSDSSDNPKAEEVKIIKEDNTKIKKEDLKIDKQLNILNNNKEIISEKNTEKFFETKYLQSSNILSPQSKNNFSNQILLNNSGFEVNAANNSNNINYGSNGNQNGTQSSSSTNNYQIYNDIKETLDMSDKRWASSLVSKINRSHASKNNELRLLRGELRSQRCCQPCVSSSELIFGITFSQRVCISFASDRQLRATA